VSACVLDITPGLVGTSERHALQLGWHQIWHAILIAETNGDVIPDYRTLSTAVHNIIRRQPFTPQAPTFFLD
jgi:hypothetical protein